MSIYASLAAWPEDRRPLSESERAEQADEFASHLPPHPGCNLSDKDIDAIKAAFIRRFNEDLPRTESLFAVAAIGYRIALRDMRESAGGGA